MAAQVHIAAEARAMPQPHLKLLRKLLPPVVLAVAVYGSGSLEVGMSHTYSYAVFLSFVLV